MPHPLIHGIDTYFGEFFANRRRVAVVLLSVSATLAVLIVVAGRHASRVLDDPKRFGFEGPKQWVERIRLEEIAEQESPGLFQITYLTAESRKGGRKPRHVSTHPQAQPEMMKVVGIGEDEVDLLAKARMLALDGPVIRSEDLVIERLVRPDYPEEARDKMLRGDIPPGPLSKPRGKPQTRSTINVAAILSALAGLLSTVTGMFRDIGSLPLGHWTLPVMLVILVATMWIIRERRHKSELEGV